MRIGSKVRITREMCYDKEYYYNYLKKEVKNQLFFSIGKEIGNVFENEVTEQLTYDGTTELKVEIEVFTTTQKDTIKKLLSKIANNEDTIENINSIMNILNGD